MFSDIGETRGLLCVDLAEIATVRQELEEFRKTRLYALLLEDLELTDQHLMRTVKLDLPETVYQEKCREQNIGQAVFAEKMQEWFDVAADKLEEYHQQYEQQTNVPNE